jgi:hypothetical protein
MELLYVQYQVNVFTQSVELYKQYLSQIGSDKYFRNTDIRAMYQANQNTQKKYEQAHLPFCPKFCIHKIHVFTVTQAICDGKATQNGADDPVWQSVP